MPVEAREDGVGRALHARPPLHPERLVLAITASMSTDDGATSSPWPMIQSWNPRPATRRTP